MRILQDPVIGDAFGRALLDYWQGSPRTHHHIERSDGLLDTEETAVYFASPEDWPDVDREVLARAARGQRVLDVGAGAGRASLALQALGVAVTALDISPGAVETCRHRGVDCAVHGTIADLVTGDVEHRYDTIVMLGNNIGLLESQDFAGAVLRRLARLGTDRVRILGTMGHTYRTEDPRHLRYHERNRITGRMPGQLRLRVRFRQVASPWFDYLFASPDELASVIGPHGWSLADVVDNGGPAYAVEIRHD